MKETANMVFLGGTCNESRWRDELMGLTRMDCFNPVVEDWDEKAQEKELRMREICKYSLYVITPKMSGVYSVAEVVDDSNKRPERTLFCYLEEDDEESFNEGQIRSLEAVRRLVERNGGRTFRTLVDVVLFLNREVGKEHNKKLKRKSFIESIKRLIWRVRNEN